MNEDPITAGAQDFSHIIETRTRGELYQTTPRAHVVDLVRRAVDSGKPIVLHLHGGLVSGESGYSIVNRLQERYHKAGHFPIFVVWHTGLFDALRSARQLADRPFFHKLLKRLLRHFGPLYGKPGGKELRSLEPLGDAEVEAELAKRYVDKVPYADTEPQPDREEMSDEEKDCLSRSISSDDDLRQEWEREVEAPETLPGGKELQMNDDVRDEARREFGKPEGKAILSGPLLAWHAVLIGARVIRRFYKHRDHGPYTTIVEEIIRQLYLDRVGTKVWDAMKRDAADTFEREGGVPERGGWLLMRQLGEGVKQRHAAGQPPTILSIVGHSAGCIYAGNLLKYLFAARSSPASPWYRAPFQVEKLVFLAPAATCRTFAAVLKKHAQEPLFRDFRMYSLTDTDEKSYYEVPVLYAGSLLYIISGLLETFDDGGTGDMPLTGMQRYSRTAHPFLEPEVVKVWQFLHSKQDHLVWSGDQRGPGLNCDSKKHGLLDSTDGTINSFLHFLGVTRA